MTLNQLIDELNELRLQVGGDIMVVAHDGMDPSDICEIEHVYHTKEYVFHRTGSDTRPVIMIRP